MEWVTGRVFGSAEPKQGQIKPKTVKSYLSALKSYHVDRNLDTQAFSSPRVNRMLSGARSLFPQIKKERLPITKDVLEQVTSVVPISIEDLNIDTAFKVAWAGFLRMGEFTYTSAESQARTFVDTKLTRSDITFSEGDQHAILRLKRSKTDVNHTGVEIILAATYDKTCPVTALRTLFVRDPQPRTAPLFRLTGRCTAFARKPVLDILQERLRAHNIITPKSYTGHSFRKGAAQHASDNGMLDQHIQKLGRWTSKAFQLYFETSISSLYTLSMRFQTGRAISFTPQILPLALLSYYNNSPSFTPFSSLGPEFFLDAWLTFSLSAWDTYPLASPLKLEVLHLIDWDASETSVSALCPPIQYLTLILLSCVQWIYIGRFFLCKKSFLAYFSTWNLHPTRSYRHRCIKETRHPSSWHGCFKEVRHK